MPVNPSFLDFLNRASTFAEAVYPGGSQQPRLAYALKSYTPEGLNSITVTIDGQTLTSSAGKARFSPVCVAEHRRARVSPLPGSWADKT